MLFPINIIILTSFSEIEKVSKLSTNDAWRGHGSEMQKVSKFSTNDAWRGHGF